ncbi:MULTISPECIES: hypothetical protein [unclassified Thioalkalivibrio]|uniref:hypothetical protein n=1 Tax=unclassified Thioalkalivibrio TaxID=2621013 RepID=UPI0003825222|nr:MULTISPECIES: hypothetical protein [unclassified Thioalkalivibrio]
MNHGDLVQLALQWLRRPASRKGPGCAIALSEVGGVFSGERADAWGYRYNPGSGGPGSTLVEVKTSRADFFADQKKQHRNGGASGMGRYRYYLCPEGVIGRDDLPPRWGLIHANARGHLKVLQGHTLDHRYLATHEEWAHPVNDRLEKELMAHLLARLEDPESINRRYREIQRITQKAAELQDENNRLRRERRRLIARREGVESAFEASGG